MRRLALLALTCQGLAPSPLQAQRDSVVSLRALLVEVRTSHPATEAARARVRAAEGQRAWAGAFDNPRFAVQVENLRAPGRPAVPQDRETMYTAELPFETLYQRGPRIRQADAEVAARRADSVSVDFQLTLATARAYYRVASAQIELETARELSVWLDSVVTYNRARSQEGLAPEAELLRAVVERDRVRAEASLRGAELAQAFGELAGFLAVPSTFRVAIPSRPLSILPGPPPGNGVAPPVAVARARLRAMEAAVAVERTMLVPAFGIILGGKETMGRTSLVGGVSLPFPLFNRNGGRIRWAAGERDAAAADLATAERISRAAVTAWSTAVAQLTAEVEVLGAVDSVGVPHYLTRADELRRIALGTYHEGAVTLLTVVDAARAWGEARLTWYRTLFAQHEAVLAQLAASGIDPLEGVRP